jgi:hypothetical protein
MCIFAAPFRNACFLCHALEIFMNLRLAKLKGTRPAGLPQAGVPEWLRGFPKHVFTRNSNIFQQAVVERIQILPPLTTN